MPLEIFRRGRPDLPVAPGRWWRLLGAWLLLTLVLTARASAEASATAPAFQGIPRDRLRLVLDHGYNLEADTPQLIAELQRDYPNSLVPEFIRVVREYWFQNYTEVDRTLAATFERDALALVDRTRRQLRAQPDDVDTACLAGLSQLLVGLYSVEQRHWWTAFWKVRAGRNAMLQILEDHPGYADAKMGAGLADCYLDRTPAYLKPLTVLLGASGNLERGLGRLREARDHGLLTSVDATYYLAAVQNELRGDPAAARDQLTALVERYPENPFYQRLLGYFEIQSGGRGQGRERLARIADMTAVRRFPALGVRSEMWLCWSCMGTQDYAIALQASQRAEQLVDADPRLKPLRSETLIGQGEALKALGRYEEAFAHFEAVSPDDPGSRQHALDRIRDIKQEIGGKK